MAKEVICDRCNGSGVEPGQENLPRIIPKEDCHRCKGHGKIPDLGDDLQQDRPDPMGPSIRVDIDPLNLN